LSIDKIPDHRSSVEKMQSPLAAFNAEKPDIAYVERLAEEAVNLMGASVRIFIKQPIIDPIEPWDEDADPMYSQGIVLKGYFKPQPRKMDLLAYGVDAKIPIVITFSRATLLQTTGIGERLIQPGDQIEIPYNHIDEMVSGPMKVRVLNATPAGNYHYRWLYHECSCENITGDEALQVRVK
jgi:hypothetical protein